MTPTPDEVEALALELAKSHCPSAGAALQSEYNDAAWILTRFVRREEHERLCAEVREWLCETCRFVYPGPPQPGLRCVVCPQCSGPTAPRHTVEMRELRAELKGQRCDGSGKFHGTQGAWCYCPSCPSCKPDATPPNIGYRRCCGSDQDKPHEEWCDNKPDATPKGDWQRGVLVKDIPESEKPYHGLSPKGVRWPCPMCTRGLCRGFGCGCACHGDGVQPTPNSDGGRTPESVSEAERASSTPTTSASGVDSAAPVDLGRAFQHAKDAIMLADMARDDYRALTKQASPVPQGLTVELGDRTLRVLYEVLYEAGILSDAQRMDGLDELVRTEETKG